MIWLIGALCGIAAGYQLFALLAVLVHKNRKPAGDPAFRPGVSLLKPVHGRDPEFFAALWSHAMQEYPEFEILFGVNDPADPAIPEVRRLEEEFPRLRISLYVTREKTANGKVGVLMELARHARYPVLLVNDGDIKVSPQYLERVVRPLSDPGVGLVTCLYRAQATDWPGRWEALGIATDFAPSTLVAPFVGVREFGLGSTLVFRAVDLKRAGGFRAVADYLADDYQLAKRLTTGLARRAVMSEEVVETGIGYDSWAGAWQHQVRWARTIRVSRPDLYPGLPVTHAGLWALVALLCGYPWLAAAVAGVRMLTALVAGVLLLRSRIAAWGFWLAPVWDLFAFAVYVAGMTGEIVVWRGRRYRVNRDGTVSAQ